MSQQQSRKSASGSQSGQAARKARNSSNGNANRRNRRQQRNRASVPQIAPNNRALSENYSVSQSVSAPQAVGLVRRSARPFVSRAMNGDIRVSHREYIQDIAGSVAFSNNQLPVNPGLPSTFPWLSKLASQYESYSFESLSFEFETTSPTTATGTVLMAVDYDASDAAPANKTQLMSYRNCVRSPPWSNCCNSSLSEDLHKLKSHYFRGGSLSANQDVKMYDVGNFNIATQGQANTNSIGELYVSYTVLLMTPQLDPTAGVISGKFTGTVNSAPFATVTGNLPATVVSSGTTTSVSTWTFTQPWQGLLSVYFAGTALTGSVPSGTATSVELAEIATGAGDGLMGIYSINAQIGQTFILTNSNTTISSAVGRFSEYLVSLA